MWMYISVPVSVFVVFTNTIVLALIYNIRRLQILRNVPLIGLATADVLVGLFWIPLATASSYIPENKELCRAALSCEILTMHASLFNLIAVSAERWIAIFKPLHYHQIANQTVVIALLTVSWILSFVMLAVFLSTDRHQDDVTECDIVKYIDKWVLFLILIIFYLVCGIMIFMQLKVYLIVRAQLRRIRPTAVPGDIKNGLMAATSFIIEESFNIEAALADDESASQRERPSTNSSRETSPSEPTRECVFGVNDAVEGDHKNCYNSGESRPTNNISSTIVHSIPRNDVTSLSCRDEEISMNNMLKIPGKGDTMHQKFKDNSKHGTITCQIKIKTGNLHENGEKITKKRVGWVEKEAMIATESKIRGCKKDEQQFRFISDSCAKENSSTAKWKNLSGKARIKKQSIDIFCVEKDTRRRLERKNSTNVHDVKSIDLNAQVRFQKLKRSKTDRKQVYYSPDESTLRRQKGGQKKSFASFVRLFSVMKRQRKSEFTRAVATNVVCLCFVLMWAPKSTIDLLTGLGQCDDCSFAHSISAVLAWTNSGINALIYAWRMNEFREALRVTFFTNKNRIRVRKR